MKKNNFFLLLSLITLTFQLGCGKNALFHTKDVKRSNYYNRGTRPVFIEPSEPIEPRQSISSTPSTTNPTNSYVPSKSVAVNSTPVSASSDIPPSKVIQTTQQEPDQLLQDFFPYRWIQKTFHQMTNEKNKTTLFFQAFNRHGLNIRDLQKDDITLSENQIEIKNYTLSSERRRLDHKLDVVFVINTAGSMKRYIDMIKNNITYFVNRLGEDQIQVNLCLVTFRDLVEKICQIFYPDNPRTPQNENTTKFLSDISNLKLHSGYNEYHENVLGGLLAAARHTPWNPGNQRMIILATDALFWIPLHNSRPEARAAPNYSTVLDALEKNNIQVFALTQSYHGFSKNYFEYPSLVEATSGGWFNIKTLEEKSMQTVFREIRDQLNVFYKIEYFVEDQEGLNAFLPLESRKISLNTKATQNEDAQIQIQDIHSNLPEGAAKLQSNWALDEPDIKKDNITVTINGVKGDLGHDFFVEDGQIFFAQPPPSGSEILVTYDLEGLINNIQKHPLNLQPSSHRETSNFSLLLNGKKAEDIYFDIQTTDDGSAFLNLKNEIFSDEDPFNIRQSNGLNISLFSEDI